MKRFDPVHLELLLDAGVSFPRGIPWQKRCETCEYYPDRFWKYSKHQSIHKFVTETPFCASHSRDVMETRAKHRYRKPPWKDRVPLQQHNRCLALLTSTTKSKVLFNVSVPFGFIGGFTSLVSFSFLSRRFAVGATGSSM